jgi:hypothetical protein
MANCMRARTSPIDSARIECLVASGYVNGDPSDSAARLPNARVGGGRLKIAANAARLFNALAPGLAMLTTSMVFPK